MPERTRVAYLTYDGLTDPLGQSQILPYILGLEASGIEFTIFSFEKPEVFEREKANINRQIEGREIIWKPLCYHKRPPVLSTLYDLYHLSREVVKEQRKKPFSIIHCRSYLTSIIGLRMKRSRGVKFIFDMRGFWADERVEGGLWNLRSSVYKLIYNFFKRQEKKFLTHSDFIISLTENAKLEIMNWNLKPAPITVIPTCVDLALFNPNKINLTEREGLKQKLGIQSDEFVLLYLGSWGTWYLTNEMLGFFSALKLKVPRAKLLIVSADQIDLRNFPYKQDVIITRSSRESVPLHISIADASLLFISSSFSKKASSATKLGEILAMNVPVVTNIGWGDVDVFKESSNYCLAVQDFNTQSFNEAIDQLLLKKNSKHDRSYVEDSLSLSSGIQKYNLVYKTLVNRD